MSVTEEAAFSEKSRQSIFESNDLCDVLGLSHKKINDMKNSTQQCVVTLHDPSHSRGDPAQKEGSASWFVRLWESLLERDQIKFREYVGGSRVLNLATPLDLCVRIQKNSTVVVLIYIESRLQKLADESFRNQSVETSMHQALRILHNPHDEYMAFIKRAYDLHEEFMKDGDMDVWLSNLKELSLS